MKSQMFQFRFGRDNQKMTILNEFCREIKKYKQIDLRFSLYGRAKSKLDNIIDKVNKIEDDCIDFENEQLSLAFNKKDTYSFLNIITEIELPDFFYVIGNIFACESDFTHGWLSEMEYEMVQSEYIDKAKLLRRGVSEQKIKTYKDKYSREFIDISKNPGRSIERDGYEEGVGSTMWISRKLCLMTGADFDSLHKVNWYKSELITPDVIRIDAWPEPFNSDEGEQGEIQRKLRDLIFPNWVNLKFHEYQE